MDAKTFTAEITRKMNSIGLTVGYNHTDVDGNLYIGSLQTVKGCKGHPKAEAQLFNDGRTQLSFNLRNA